MRRVLLGLILGALIFGVAFAGAKVATVTNPMSGDLDGGGHQISNVTAYFTPEGALVANNFLVAHALNLSTGETNIVSGPQVSVFAGSDDPTTGVFSNTPPASLYLRQIDDTHAALYFKTGGNVPDWTCLVGCTP